MPPPVSTIEAIVLRQEKRGERFLCHTVLSPELGVVYVMQRLSSKPDKVRIDLFDQGEFQIDLKPGEHSGFLKEFHLRLRRDGLSRNYQALKSASELSLILIANPTHEDDSRNRIDLLLKGLNALESENAPRSTLIKCLYLLCKNEGYPVKEQWIRDLGESEARDATSILNSKLSDLDESKIPVERILENLKHFIEHHTSLRMV